MEHNRYIKDIVSETTYYGKHQIVYNGNRGHEVFPDMTGFSLD